MFSWQATSVWIGMAIAHMSDSTSYCTPQPLYKHASLKLKPYQAKLQMSVLKWSSKMKNTKRHLILPKQLIFPSLLEERPRHNDLASSTSLSQYNYSLGQLHYKTT